MWMQIIQKILNRVGGFGGDMAQAQTIFNEADQARLNELKRRQEMGALGLSDEEMGVLRERSVAPVQSALREQQIRSMADTQIQDVGSGSAARLRAADTDRYNRQLAEAGVGIAAANEAARQKQEQELLDLAGAKEDKKWAMWTAAFNNLVADNGNDFTQISNTAQQERADAQDEDAIFSGMEGMDAGDAEMASEMMSSYGGGGGGGGMGGF